jgi:choline dehydrogenase
MFAGPQQPAFIQALQNATGIRHSKDLNGGSPNSVSITPLTSNPGDSGHRSSSAQAYLTPVEGSRQNWLTVISHMVTKINFKDDQLPLIATGIEFSPVNSTTRYQAFASREVILSAGAIQTPALLQLSGIGDSSLLEPLGIPTLLNHTTVGKNLQEQTLDLVIAHPSGFDPEGAGPQDAIAFPNLYELFGKEANSAVKNISSSISAWADSQAENAVSAKALKEIFELQAKLVIDHTSPLFELFFITTPDFVGMSMWNLLPFSRGSVKISSSNPFTKPVVDVNYFGVDFDMKVQIHGTRLARKVLQTAPLSSLVTQEIAPGDAVPDDTDGGSDADWEAWIRKDFNANSHPLGTAAMMRRNLGGVVDARLKVYDTRNLRVVDASILPMQLSAHLSGSLYGVAEKAADLIKEDQHKH